MKTSEEKPFQEPGIQNREAHMKHLKLITLAAVALAAVPLANAIPIYLGSQAGEPASAEQRLVRLNQQIDLYNSTYSPDLPTAVIEGNSQIEDQTGTSITVDVTGWSYLVLKWAHDDFYWYVGGDTGSLLFESQSFNEKGNAQDLSGYGLFNPTTRVPDGASTVVLLGLGLIGLAGLRRFGRK
jgi:hypothetical protein